MGQKLVQTLAKSSFLLASPVSLGVNLLSLPETRER